MKFYKCDPKNVSDDLWTKLCDFSDKYVQQLHPGDPPKDRSQIRDEIDNPHRSYEIDGYLFEDQDQIVGWVIAWRENENSATYDSNKHILRAQYKILSSYFDDPDLEEFTKDLFKFVEASSTLTTIQLWAFEKEIEDLAIKNGGKLVQGWNDFRLYLDQVPWESVSKWYKEGEDQNNDLSISKFDELPEELIDSYCIALTESLQDMPHDDNEIEYKATPKQYRENRRLIKERGKIIYSHAVLDGKRIVALTDMLYKPDYPHCAYQLMTYVIKDFRGRRIGRWLKASMLLHLKVRHPAIGYIGTNTATSNKYMQAINQELGFKEVKKGGIYSFKVQ